MSEDQVRVEVAYGELKATFSGSPDEVYTTVSRFLAQNLPQIEIAKKVTLRYDLKDLVESFGDYVKITDEGPRVMPSERLSLKQRIALQLVAARIAYLLGKTKSDRLSLQELGSALGVATKSISSRLSELVKAGNVQRASDETGTAYSVTTLGIKWLLDTFSGRARPE